MFTAITLLGLAVFSLAGCSTAGPARLKVNKTQLEAWAMILEEHSLLELRYPTIGEPEVAYTASDKAAKKDDADGRKKR